MVEEKVWLTQEEIADRLGLTLAKIRPVVAAFGRVGSIETRVDPQDNRYMLVHKDSLSLLAKALGIPSIGVSGQKE